MKSHLVPFLALVASVAGSATQGARPVEREGIPLTSVEEKRFVGEPSASFHVSTNGATEIPKDAADIAIARIRRAYRESPGDKAVAEPRDSQTVTKKGKT